MSDEPDIFERFDKFVGEFIVVGVNPLNSEMVHHSLDWQSNRLWLVGGCIMLHEDGRDG